ncbi:MAG: hypothetical protein QOH81_3102, partial [Sphingomonadales bacterium]|nr:hypothetical protein [Sphingomonadales bacterium]
ASAATTQASAATRTAAPQTVAATSHRCGGDWGDCDDWGGGWGGDWGGDWGDWGD